MFKLLHFVIIEPCILDTHISIGGTVIDAFEPSVKPLINSSLVLAAGEPAICLCY